MNPKTLFLLLCLYVAVQILVADIPITMAGIGTASPMPPSGGLSADVADTLGRSTCATSWLLSDGPEEVLVDP